VTVGKQRALLTGVSGFTGRYAATALREAGYEVHGTALSVDGANNHACDLSRPDELAELIERVRPQKVLHLGALSFVGEEDVRAFYDVNVFGTGNLLESLASMDRPPVRVVIASSANVYGATESGSLSEDRCPQPINHYAISKLAMERVAAMYAHRLSIVVTRPFNYTGVGQDCRFLVPKLIAHFAEGRREVQLGNLEVSRDFSDVRDIVRMYVRLLQDDVPAMTVNLCSGRVYSLRQIISMLEEIAGYRIEVVQDPRFMRANEVQTLRGDDARLVSVLGEFSRYELRHTLDWMLRA